MHVATAAGSAVRGVEYMRRSGDAWTRMQPEPFHGVGCGVGLGVAPDGSAHVAYMLGDVLRVMRYGPSGSALSEPDRFDWIGSPYLSAAVDAQGRPHIAYADPAGLVKHAVRIGDAWVTSPIAGGGDAPEVAMLPDGRAAIVHAVSGGVRGPISLEVGGD